MRFSTLIVLAAAALVACAGPGCESTGSTGKDRTGQPVDSTPPADEPAQPALDTPAKTAEAVAAAVNDSRGAAESGLVRLRALADEARFTSLGFASVQEAQGAALGAGLAVVRVRLDQLQRLRPDQKLHSLLQPPDRVVWSVMAGDAVRSSVTTERGEQGWAANRFGGSKTIQAIARARSALRDKAGDRDRAGEYLVSVPALNLLLVAHQAPDGRVLLASTIADESLRLEAATPVPAEDLLPRLAEAAKQHDGRPR